MRFKLYEENEYLSTNYIFEVPVIIYNQNDRLEEGIEKLSNKIIDNIEENMKFIKEALGLDSFECFFKEFNNPTLSLIGRANKSLDTNDLSRVIRRYFKAEIEIDNMRLVTVQDWIICKEYFEPID